MSPPSLDLDPESRRALEFDAVLDLVAGEAGTGLGGAAVRALEPAADPAWIAAEQGAVSEARRYLQAHGRLVAGGLPDPAPALEGLEVEGLKIGAPELRDLARVLLASDEARRRLGASTAGEFPRLAELASGLPGLREEARVVAERIGPDGRLQDDASPELKRIRAAIGRVGERLRRMLERLVRDPGAESYIRDDFITQRNGRFVIPARADAPRPVRGIVHAASSSGATLFVEPLESVELNNERVQLCEGEQEEQDRVLRSWTEAFRLRRDDVLKAVAGVARIDSLQARALFAERSSAVQPVVEEAGDLELRDVRHPLLDARLRQEGSHCVPITLSQAAAERVLVLSGPNTGGKTVALKTVGLASLMAQAGLPVCASDARLPFFRQVRADIGDHQSIEADLSTFSAHVRAAARFLRQAATPALFLFDEIGTGTEPMEGAALAQAVLERVLTLDVTTVVTTHQGAIKAWAFTTAGARSAAMEFDVQTLQPTFRVLMDAAGVSAGLDIAARLELPESLVRRARALLGPEASQTEAYLNRIQQRMLDLDRAKESLAQRELELEGHRQELDEARRREEDRRRRETARALDTVVEELRTIGRRELAKVRDARERARLLKSQERAERRLRTEAERRKARLSPRTGDREEGRPAEIEVGARVRVRSLDREGEIVNLRGTRVRVRMGGATFTVDRGDLVAPSATPAPTDPSHGVRFRHARAEVQSPGELLLVGKTVDEALPELDKFLDEAALSGRDEVRVVHGHGTGRLRAAVRRFLKGHPHVADQRPGTTHEGGDGATVVSLK